MQTFSASGESSSPVHFQLQAPLLRKSKQANFLLYLSLIDISNAFCHQAVATLQSWLVWRDDTSPRGFIYLFICPFIIMRITQHNSYKTKHPALLERAPFVEICFREKTLMEAHFEEQTQVPREASHLWPAGVRPAGRTKVPSLRRRIARAAGLLF